MKSENVTLPQQQPNAPWHTGMLHAFPVVFSLILFLAHVSGFAHAVTAEHPSGSHAFHCSRGDHIYIDHHAEPPVLGVGLVFVETEVADETESGSEFDTDFNTLSITAPAMHSGKSLLLRLKLTDENRQKISLVVLYHCWKNPPHLNFLLS